jgi:hypothetical protein
LARLHAGHKHQRLPDFGLEAFFVGARYAAHFGSDCGTALEPPPVAAPETRFQASGVQEAQKPTPPEGGVWLGA